MTVLRDVKRVARQRVAAQRVLFVDLQAQQLLEVDLRLLNLRLPRERVGDARARVSNVPCTAKPSVTTKNAVSKQRSGDARERCRSSRRRHRTARSKNGWLCAARVDPTIFKSYDVRGVYPSELSDDVAYAIGRCFVPMLGAGARRNRTVVAVGRDMRPSGAKLFDAFARGATEAGADVVDIGLVSTDALYFAVGKYDFDGGVMITASHNPAAVQRHEVHALAGASHLARHRAGDDPRPARSPATFRPRPPRAGTVTQRDVLDDFAQHCLSFVDRAKIKPFKIAIDAGNGMAGETVPHVFKHPAVRRRAALLRARRQLSEPSGQPDRAREHGRSAGARSASTAAISASPSTATPTGCSSSTRRPA